MAKPKKLLWQIYLPFIGVLVIALSLISWQTTRTLRRVYIQKQIEDLTTRSILIRELADDLLSPPQPSRVDSLCTALGKSLNCRFTVVLKSGRVIGDTEESPDEMDNHKDRPEIRNAMQGLPGVATRFSYTLDKEMLYVAVPFGAPESYSGVIRAAMPLDGLTQSLHALYRRIGIAAFIIAAFAAGIAFSLSQRIRKPISELIRGADRFGRGDLKHRLYVTHPVEFYNLAGAMNAMAEDLDARIRTVTQQRNEIETILASMVEAIVAIDMNGIVIRFNHAASGLFHIGIDAAYGKNIREVVRNTELTDFIVQTLEKSEPQEAEIHLIEGDCILQAHGTALYDSEKNRIGALVVMHDITQIKRLETVRKDFVANVSHELKTPITSIKGFVETLRDGAIDDPKNARRFLDILVKQADRLNAIIDDLLKLSRLDGNRHTPVELVEASITDVLESALEICRDGAEKKQIQFEKEWEPNLFGPVDASLLEEAVVNLVDNAVMYSDPGSRVRISAQKDAEEIQIRVQDWGIGIPKKHLDRIFERFYRVDKARSRDLGGTGLGLAIVKHIAEIHNGNVTVESIVGEGSTFTLHLPV